MILGIAGYAHSGKTTLARHLVEEHGYVRLSFAAPIRQALLAMGIPECYLTDHKAVEVPKIGKSGRYLMQTLGTEWARSTVNKNFWLYLMDQKIDGLIGQNIVIDDVRFDNEARYIQAKKGYVLNIVRGNTQLEPYNTGHASEDGVSSDLVDYTIENSGSVAAAVEKLDEISCRLLSTTSQPMM
tara:strand:+ start:14107 stop:14658 length:552 start_codon:yes stop_codon:yes gene_type:complete